MILVVEDRADIRSGLVCLLSSDGYHAVGCACGREAIEFLNCNKPSLIVLDCGLPDIDGLTVLRAIRSDRRFDDTRVIMFSAYEGAERDEARRAGVDAYVVKSGHGTADLRAQVRRLAGALTPTPCPPGG